MSSTSSSDNRPFIRYMTCPTKRYCVLQTTSMVIVFTFYIFKGRSAARVCRYYFKNNNDDVMMMSFITSFITFMVFRHIASFTLVQMNHVACILIPKMTFYDPLHFPDWFRNKPLHVVLLQENNQRESSLTHNRVTRPSAKLFLYNSVFLSVVSSYSAGFVNDYSSKSFLFWNVQKIKLVPVITSNTYAIAAAVEETL